MIAVGGPARHTALTWSQEEDEEDDEEEKEEEEEEEEAEETAHIKSNHPQVGKNDPI